VRVSPALIGRVLLAAAALAAAAPRAAAQGPYTWNQTTDGNWSTASWTGGVPVSNAADVINFNGTTGYTATDDIAGTFQFKQMIFNNTGTGQVTIASSSGSNILSIATAGSTGTPSIVQNGSAPILISAPITNSAAAFVGGTGTGTVTFADLRAGGNWTFALPASTGVTVTQLTVSGGGRTVTNTGPSTLTVGNIYLSEVSGTGRTLTLSATSTVIVNGVIANFNGGAGTAGSFIKGNGGNLFLNAAATYTGDTTINNGIMFIGLTNAIPTGTNLNMGNGSSGTNFGTLDLNGFNQRVATLQITATNMNTGQIVGNSAATPSTFTVQSGTSSTYGGLIGVAGKANLGLTKAGAGTFTLSGTASLYTGPTTITAGVLSVAGLADAGSASSIGVGDNTSGATNAASLVFNGGTLQYTGATAAANRGFTVNATNGTIDLPAGVSLTLGGDTTGAGTLNKTNTTATLIFTGNANHANTAVPGGTLQVGAGGTSGALGGNVTDNAALVFSRTDTATYAGTVTGSGTVTQIGGTTGTLVLTGTLAHTGGTTITSGTLQVGNGGTTGTLGGNVVNNGTLAFNRSDAVTFAGAITGTGTVTQAGTGTLTLTGANTLAAVTVATGTLVAQPGTLGAAAAVTVTDGAAFGAANSTSTSVGLASLTLGTATGGTLRFVLNGPPSVAPLAVSATNGLTANGTTTVTILNGSTPLTVGSFPLLSYAGAVQGSSSGATNFGFTIGTLPPRIVANLDTTTAGLVKLNITQFDTIKWAGTAAGNPSDWDINTTQNWVLSSNGTTPTTYLEASVPGDTVTFAATTGTRAVNLTTTLSPTAVTADTTTGDYTFAGPGGLAGPGSLTKTGTGTLVLATVGANTFTGGTTVSAGTLQVGDGTTTGSLPGTVTNNGTLAFNPGAGGVTVAGTVTGSGTLTTLGPNPVTVTGAVTGAQAVQVAGTGLVVMTGTNTYTGGTTIAAGAALQVGDGAITGALPGAVANAGTLTFKTGTTPVTASGAITGTGSVTVQGTNTVVFTSTGNAYTGGTTVAGTATLQIGDGISSGSVPGNVTDNAVLAFNPAAAGFTYPGVVSGTGAVSVLGTGTTTFTGANTYTGTTTVAAGATLRLGDGTTPGTLPGNATDNGTVVFNPGTAISYGGANTAKISGTGGLTLLGGALTLTSKNTYTGPTTVTAGTLRVGITVAVSTSTDVTLAAAGTLDLNNTSLTINSLAGSGPVTLGTGTLTLNGANATTYAGVISGTGGLSRLNGGTTTLTGHGTYTGSTNIQNAGSYLVLGVDDALPPATTVTSAGTTNTNVGLDLNGFNQHLASLISPSLTTGTFFVRNNSGAGTSVLTITAGAGIYGGGNTATNASAAAIIQDDDGSHPGGKTAVTVAGGTLTLTDSSTYTGPTTVTTGGAILLKFDATGTGRPTTNLLGPNTPVVLGGGTLSVRSKSAATNAQTVNGLTVAAGDSAVVMTTNSATSLALTLGPVTTRAVGGVVDFTIPAGSTVSTTTANAVFAGGQQTILGGYATVGKAGWAATGTGTGPFNVTALGTYDTAQNFTAGADADAQLGTIAPGTMTVNSIRFNNAGASTVTPSPAGATLTVATGGVLVTAGVGANAVGIDPTGLGVLTSGNGQDLILIQNNTAGGLTVGSLISGAIGLTKSGPGTVTLANGADNYTGPTVVNAGTLLVANATGSATGTGPVSVAGGATFGGTGQVTGSVTIAKGGFVAPGTAVAVGTLTTGPVVLGTGATYQARLGTAVPGPANTSDLLSVTGTFNLGTGSVVKLGSLATGFTPGNVYTYRIGSATAYQLDGTAVADPFTYGTSVVGGTSTGPVVVDGTSFAAAGDSFQLQRVGPDLVLTYTTASVPEPAVAGLLAAAGLAGVLRRRRQGAGGSQARL
jgi:autotransporter-associated beta strand protein